MRRHHEKSGQYELFGLSDKSNPLTTPEWQSLPTQTRQKITGLMARLLVEHGQQQATERVGKDFGPAQTGENSDV